MFEAGSRKRLIQGTIFGAAATMIVGFNFGGWTLGGTAERMANDRAVSALVTAYTPVCVARYEAEATTAQQAEFLNDKWNRGNVIEKTGFATTAISESPEREVAMACANVIEKLLPKIATQ